MSTPSQLEMQQLELQQFGRKLHFLRTQRNMTLKELAAAIGHSAHGHISELESGKKTPTAEFVLNVARFFDVTTDQLLKDEMDVPANFLRGDTELD